MEDKISSGFEFAIVSKYMYRRTVFGLAESRDTSLNGFRSEQGRTTCLALAPDAVGWEILLGLSFHMESEAINRCQNLHFECAAICHLRSKMC